MKATKGVAQGRQEPYIRARENPYFNGLVRGNDSLMDQAPAFDFRGGAGSKSVSRSKSDIGETIHRNNVSDTSEKVLDSSFEDSVIEFGVEPLQRSSSLRWSKVTKTTSFAFPSVKSDLSFESDDHDNLVKESSPRTFEGKDGLPYLGRPRIEKSYSINKRKLNLSRITLPQCAASFYNGNSPQMEIVESCDSINRLNLYLKGRKDDVNAGAPGRFLHVILGQDASEIGSVASTIMYAFYLNETLKNDHLCTVPVINMKRVSLNAHAELKWLLDSCQIDQSSLIFIDEIDLWYYDLFGSLKLVILNGDKLPTKQEALKEAVVEIFNCRENNSSYPWVKNVTVGQDCSSCTLVAEKFALNFPEILTGQGFSRVLLAGILLDTGNLSNPRCTSKDKYMATLLINGAGRFGCNGLYQILRYKLYDVSDLKVADILRKDFKKWKRVGKPDGGGTRIVVSHVGMSSIGISVVQLLSHEDASAQEIKFFQQSEKLRLLMVVSGYYDTQKNFKREILVSAESAGVMKNLLFFFNSNSSQLPLKVLDQPGLKDEMRAFEIDKVLSRKTIEGLLEEFGKTSKG